MILDAGSNDHQAEQVFKLHQFICNKNNEEIIILDDRYLALLNEYQSIYKQLEGNLARSKVRIIEAQLHHLETQVARSKLATTESVVSRKAVFAAFILENVLKNARSRARVRLDWAGHVDRVNAIIGPLPPKRPKQYRGPKIGYR